MYLDYAEFTQTLMNTERTQKDKASVLQFNEAIVAFLHLVRSSTQRESLHRCSAASVGAPRRVTTISAWTKHSSGTIYVAFRDPGQILYRRFQDSWSLCTPVPRQKPECIDLPALALKVLPDTMNLLFTLVFHPHRFHRSMFSTVIAFAVVLKMW